MSIPRLTLEIYPLRKADIIVRTGLLRHRMLIISLSIGNIRVMVRWPLPSIVAETLTGLGHRGATQLIQVYGGKRVILPYAPKVCWSEAEGYRYYTVSYASQSILYSCNLSPGNVYPLIPHFYIVKLGNAGVYLYFLFFAPKHRLWVLVRTASPRRF